MVCVPETYWRPQMEMALDELRAEAVAHGKDPNKVFLTKNDILTAWILRCVIGPMNMSPDRLVSIPHHSLQYTNPTGRRINRHVPPQSL